LAEDGYERAKNPVAFYSDSDGQKCLVDPTKMSRYIKDKENPKEEINHSYANGFISKKEKSYKKEKKRKYLKISTQLLLLALLRSSSKLLIYWKS